jgi:hypothetical protein
MLQRRIKLTEIPKMYNVRDDVLDIFSLVHRHFTAGLNYTSCKLASHEANNLKLTSQQVVGMINTFGSRVDKETALIDFMNYCSMVSVDSDEFREWGAAKIAFDIMTRTFGSGMNFIQ